MRLMFLDESGDHNLKLIDPHYPIFILGGVIVDRAYAEEVLAVRLNSFKRSMFGHEDQILHTADLTRNRKGFERMKSEAFRREFYRELNCLMADLQYRVIACAIRKDHHLAKNGHAARDPYLLSLNVLVELFCLEIGNHEHEGLMIAERRDPILDRDLELAWSQLKANGTRHMNACQIEHRLTGLELHDKKANIAGLQLADLVVTPIGRMLLGKAIQEDFRIVASKFVRGPSGEVNGFGLVTLPESRPSKRKGQPPLRSDQPTTKG